MIKQGNAYVDDQTSQQIAEQKGTPTQEGTNSPFRDRSVDENLALFEKMKKNRPTNLPPSATSYNPNVA